MPQVTEPQAFRVYKDASDGETKMQMQHRIYEVKWAKLDKYSKQLEGHNYFSGIRTSGLPCRDTAGVLLHHVHIKSLTVFVFVHDTLRKLRVYSPCSFACRSLHLPCLFYTLNVRPSS